MENGGLMSSIFHLPSSIFHPLSSILYPPPSISLFFISSQSWE